MDYAQPQPAGPFIQGACAIHPQQMAARTCLRCGNFMCDTCSENRTLDYCPPCRAIVGAGVTGFPLHRDSWTFDALLNYTWTVFKRDGLMLTLATLVVFVVSFGINMVSTLLRFGVAMSGSEAISVAVTLVSFVVQIVVQGVFQLGVIKLTLDSLQGKPIEFADMFRQIGRLGPYVAQLFLIMVATGIPLTVLGGGAALIAYAASASTEIIVLMGIITAMLAFFALLPVILPFAFANMEIVHDANVGVIQSLKNCWTIASGQRVSIFLVYLLAIPISIAGMLMCFIGLLPATAFFQLLACALYLTLRNGVQLKPTHPYAYNAS